MKELEAKDGKLDTKGMLENSFLEEFSKVKGGKLPKTNPLERASEGTVASSTPLPSNTNTEELLMEAYEARDNLISSFSEVKLGSSLANKMADSINKVGSIIVKLGGEAEAFDPLAHVSGLGTPNAKKYASRVIENTIDSYSLGQIENAEIDKESNGKTIIVTFAGRVDEVCYKAIGTITTERTWLGTEAIDYVYTPGEGKMSVKVANHNGEWVDQSDNYQISWELLESDKDENLEKKAESKEDKEPGSENNVNDDINDDFPIEEK
jgi:hypothetical protein